MQRTRFMQSLTRTTLLISVNGIKDYLVYRIEQEGNIYKKDFYTLLIWLPLDAASSSMALPGAS